MLPNRFEQKLAKDAKGESGRTLGAIAAWLICLLRVLRGLLFDCFALPLKVSYFARS